MNRLPGIPGARGDAGAGHRHVWRAGPDGSWVSVGSSFLRRTGLDLPSCLGSGWMRMVHGSDRDALRDTLSAPDAETLAAVAEARLWSAPQRRYVPSLFFAEAELEPDGGIREWIGSITDATTDAEGLALRDQMRDVLVSIRAIVHRSAESTAGVDELAMHLDGRLTALARIQRALLRRPGAGILLLDLAMDELRSFAGHGNERLRLGGPDIRVRGKLAELIGLVLHELATNAVKFGALRTGQGRVDLDWCLADGEELVIRWREEGGDGRPEPAREGFGHDLLTRTLPTEFAASVSAEWQGSGAVWTIVLPTGGPAAPFLDL